MKPDAATLSFSQNFLSSSTLVKKIVALARLAPGATVLEIGPGLGIITTALARQVGPQGKVIAVEADPGLAAALRKKFSAYPSVYILSQNILDFELQQLEDPFFVFANVPFNITAPLLAHLFQPQFGPATAHLILQTNALAAPTPSGNAGLTYKSCLLLPLYTIESVFQFSRKDFQPQPAVDTNLFAFHKRVQPLIAPQDISLYRDFLTFVAPARVQEGAWRTLFSKKQLARLQKEAGLVPHRGLKAQPFSSLLAAFHVFLRGDQSKHQLVQGALAHLQKNQRRTMRKNLREGHHPKRRSSK